MSPEQTKENEYQAVYDCKISDEYKKACVGESTKAAFYIYGKFKETTDAIIEYHTKRFGSVSDKLYDEIYNATDKLDDFILNMIKDSIRENANYKDKIEM